MLPEDPYLRVSNRILGGVSMSDPQPARTGMLTVEPSPRLWWDVETRIRRRLFACENAVAPDTARCPVPRELDSGVASTGGASAKISGVRWRGCPDLRRCSNRPGKTPAAPCCAVPDRTGEGPAGRGRAQERGQR